MPMLYYGVTTLFRRHCISHPFVIVAVLRPTRYCYTTTCVPCSTHGNDRTVNSAAGGGSGIGLHNVHDQVLVSERQDAPRQHEVQIPHGRNVRVIGAPMTYGQPYVGTDKSPNYLREIGLIEKLRQLSWNVHDYGNLPFEEYIANTTSSVGNAMADLEQHQHQNQQHTLALQNFHGKAKNLYEVGMGTFQLAQLVSTTLRDDKQFPLILGGDHSIGIGSLAGIVDAYPDVGVLWIDAHADINTPYISESGNLHGMPIGFLMDPVMERTFEQYQMDHKLSSSSGTGTADTATMIPGFEWLHTHMTNRLQSNQVVYIGLRDVDIQERKLITSLGIQAYTMHDIDRTCTRFIRLTSFLIDCRRLTLNVTSSYTTLSHFTLLHFQLQGTG
jgi:arginase